MTLSRLHVFRAENILQSKCHKTGWSRDPEVETFWLVCLPARAARGVCVSLGDGGCLWRCGTVPTCHQWLIVFWGPAGFRGPFARDSEGRLHISQGLVNYLKQMKNLKVWCLLLEVMRAKKNNWFCALKGLKLNCKCVDLDSRESTLSIKQPTLKSVGPYSVSPAICWRSSGGGMGVSLPAEDFLVL